MGLSFVGVGAPGAERRTRGFHDCFGNGVRTLREAADLRRELVVAWAGFVRRHDHALVAAR